VRAISRTGLSNLTEMDASAVMGTWPIVSRHHEALLSQGRALCRYLAAAFKVGFGWEGRRIRLC